MLDPKIRAHCVIPYDMMDCLARHSYTCTFCSLYLHAWLEKMRETMHNRITSLMSDWWSLYSYHGSAPPSTSTPAPAAPPVVARLTRSTAPPRQCS
jgi:hypothetical protein